MAEPRLKLWNHFFELVVAQLHIFPKAADRGPADSLRFRSQLGTRYDRYDNILLANLNQHPTGATINSFEGRDGAPAA